MKKLFDHCRFLSSDGRAGTRLEHEGLDLENCLLDGLDLSRAKIPGACFGAASLKYTRFLQTDLRDSGFTDCDVEGADFTGAALAKACFAGTEYQKAHSFEGADTETTIWTDDDLSRQLLLDYESFRVANPTCDWSLEEFTLQSARSARLPDRQP